MKPLIYTILSFLSFGIISPAFAENQSIGEIAGNLFEATETLHGIIQVVLVVAGAALLLGSLLQYRKYRENPIETRLSTVIFLFFLGLLLIVLAFIPMQGIIESV